MRISTYAAIDAKAITQLLGFASRHRRILCMIGGMLLASHAGMASSFSFTGALDYDTDVRLFTFTVTDATPAVSLRTYSYAGGVNAAGTTILAGGFDPVLDLYMQDGLGMNPGPPGPCGGNLAADPSTGGCEDVEYPTTLSFPDGTWMPGTYFVALTTNVNSGLGNLSDGFFGTGVLGLTAPANFSCGSDYQAVAPGSSPTNAFCDDLSPYPSVGAQRNGSYALDIIGVSSAAEVVVAPEPGTLSLILLTAAFFAMCKKRSASRP